MKEKLLNIWINVEDFLEDYIEHTISFTLLVMVILCVCFFCKIEITAEFGYWLFGCLGGGLGLTFMEIHDKKKKQNMSEDVE